VRTAGDAPADNVSGPFVEPDESQQSDHPQQQPKCNDLKSPENGLAPANRT
jgi:hypothetical protein